MGRKVVVRSKVQKVTVNGGASEKLISPNATELNRDLLMSVNRYSAGTCPEGILKVSEAAPRRSRESTHLIFRSVDEGVDVLFPLKVFVVLFDI